MNFTRATHEGIIFIHDGRTRFRDRLVLELNTRELNKV